MKRLKNKKKQKKKKKKRKLIKKKTKNKIYGINKRSLHVR